MRFWPLEYYKSFELIKKVFQNYRLLQAAQIQKMKHNTNTQKSQVLQ